MSTTDPDNDAEPEDATSEETLDPQAPKAATSLTSPVQPDKKTWQ